MILEFFVVVVVVVVVVVIVVLTFCLQKCMLAISAYLLAPNTVHVLLLDSQHPMDQTNCLSYQICEMPPGIPTKVKKTYSIPTLLSLFSHLPQICSNFVWNFAIFKQSPDELQVLVVGYGFPQCLQSEGNK